MKHHQIEQNTDEWLDLRKGKFTTSSFCNLFADKSKAQYINEIYRVVYEILTNESPEFYTDKYTDRGHEFEPFAKKEYGMQTFCDVTDGGFFELNKFVGSSPDGLVGEDGLIEIKCPKYSTMIDYLLTPKLPSQYKWQVYGQLYVTKRKWCDFMAYHPKLKPIIVRVYPDEKIFAELEAELDIATKKVKDVLKRLK